MGKHLTAIGLLLLGPCFTVHAVELCITVPDAKVAKIQRATDLWNARHGTVHTAKQWAKETVKRAVQNELQHERSLQANATVEGAKRAFEAAIAAEGTAAQEVYDEEGKGW